MSKTLSRLPFDPARCPFFYGWFILSAAIIVTMASIPGQTFGVSAFTEPLITSLAIERTGISFAYLIGTAGSALLLTWGGKAYDAWGARATGFAASVAMGLILLFLAQVETMTAGLGRYFGEEHRSLIAFSLLSFGFLGLRFSGQGVLVMVSRNMLMKWFDHRRGLVNGIVGIFVPVFFSVSPLLFNQLIRARGWAGAWSLMGTVALLGLGIFILFFFRDNPEECGLEPDGGMKAAPGDPRHDPIRDYSLAGARRTLKFWMFNLTIALHAFLTTGLTFHIVSIFDIANIGETKAFAIFLPASIITVVIALTVGWISDHIPLKWPLFFLMAGMTVLIIGIFLLHYPIGYYMVIAGYGGAGGVFGLLMTVTWPRFFGRRHLGAISGFHMSWTVGFSAVGPYFMGFSYQHTESYLPAFLVVFGCMLILFIGALKLQRC